FRLIPLLAAAALAVSDLAPAQAQAPDFPAGTYKVLLPLQGDNKSQALWLVKLEMKEDKPTGTVLAHPPEVANATPEGPSVAGGLLKFNLMIQPGPNQPAVPIQFECKLPKEKGAKVLGSVTFRTSYQPAILEPTELTGLDPYDLAKEALAKSSGVEAV